MSGACSTYGRGEVYTGFGWGNLMEGCYLEDPDLDRKLIFRTKVWGTHGLKWRGSG